MNENKHFFRATAEDFHKIPGSPIAYWLSEALFAAFRLPSIEKIVDGRMGLTSGNNDHYLRLWYEVSFSGIGFNNTRQSAKESEKTWFPFDKAGEFRRWRGNQDYVVNWKNDGREMQTTMHPGGLRIWAHNFNLEYNFIPHLSWSDIATTMLSFRAYPQGFLFDASANALFLDQDDRAYVLGLLNSTFVKLIAPVLNPTIHFKLGDLYKLPYIETGKEIVEKNVCILEKSSQFDWDSYETSWDFKVNPLVAEARHFGEIMLSDVYDVVRDKWAKATVKMRELEIQNNEIFIRAYGLEGELFPDVPWNEVSLTCNPWYRYGRQPEGGSPSPATAPMPRDADLEDRLRADTAKELVSYAVGCMMGRYSLDRPGLVLADAGGTLEDYRAKLREAGVETPRFEPDEDGIIPILDADWFEDDVVTRFHAFLRAAFGEASFHANVAWLEDALGKDLRSYFVKDFYADHVQRYQKRPVYWLFSSRKGAFQALVYLHRYRPDTPGRVLGYLRSYIAKVAARIEALDRIAADPSAARGTRTAALRERTKLAKAQAEIADYERDVLYPLSTERPALDLDDGVKANYPKLGAALRKIF